MKSSIILFFIVLALFASCEDEKEYSKGVVLGGDMRLCSCCGGYVVEIDNETYRFFNEDLPPGSPDFDAIEEFPVNVDVKWKKEKNSCLNEMIIVYRIKLGD